VWPCCSPMAEAGLVVGQGETFALITQGLARWRARLWRYTGRATSAAGCEKVLPEPRRIS